MNDDAFLYRVYLSIRKSQQIHSRKKQLMKRRAKNVDYYFTNNRRDIDRVKYNKFIDALR